jgi:hypothetical protein
MMKNSLQILGISVTTALGLGCGAGDSKALTQSDFCAQKAEKECTAIADRCLSMPAPCKAARIAACDAFAAAQQQQPSAVARPFSPDKVPACLSKATEIYAKLSISPADRKAMDDVCARVFSGTK